jgi:hypothetical protein
MRIVFRTVVGSVVVAVVVFVIAGLMAARQKVVELREHDRREDPRWRRCHERSGSARMQASFASIPA